LTGARTISRRGFLVGAGSLLLAGCLPDGPDPSTWGSWCSPEPSAAAGEIPAPLLDTYQQVGAEYGLPWSLLAAIGYIESRHTPDAIGPPLDGGPNVRAIPASAYGIGLHGDRRWERAVGMMQFLPGTFATYRDRGIVEDPRDPADAVTAAAAYLTDSGAPEDLRGALLRYNNSTKYVQDVLDAAARYDVDGAIPTDCAMPHYVDLADLSADPAAIIAAAEAGHIGLDDRNRRDVLHPSTDPRVLAIMALIGQQHSFDVSVMREGHYKCIGGGNGTCGPRGVSNHWYGRAVDIHTLDGVRVSRSNQAAHALVGQLHDMAGPLRPDEVGGPFGTYTSSPGWFTDANHQGHLHIGWNEQPREQRT